MDGAESKTFAVMTAHCRHRRHISVCDADDGTLQPRMGQTPFATTGSLPVWVFALITLVLGRDRA